MKNIILIMLITLLTYGNSNVNVKDIRDTHKNSNVLKYSGPIKNIPPPVLASLRAAISSFDKNFNPTFENSTVTWSRDNNIFHVNVFHPCKENDLFGYLFLADIAANGNIISSIEHDLECGHIPL